jgi:hypothetical protein
MLTVLPVSSALALTGFGRHTRLLSGVEFSAEPLNR